VVVTGSWILVLDVNIDPIQVQPAIRKALAELAGVEVLDVTVIMTILESLHVASPQASDRWMPLTGVEMDAMKRRLDDASPDNMTADYFISVSSTSGESVAGQLTHTTPVTAAAAVAAQLTSTGNFSVQVVVKDVPTIIAGENPKSTTDQTSTTSASTTDQTSTTSADMEAAKAKEKGRNKVFWQTVAISAVALMGLSS